MRPYYFSKVESMDFVTSVPKMLRIRVDHGTEGDHDDEQIETTRLTGPAVC